MKIIIILLCEPPGSQQGRHIDVDTMDERSSHIHQDIQHDKDNLNLKVNFLYGLIIN